MMMFVTVLIWYRMTYGYRPLIIFDMSTATLKTLNKAITGVISLNCRDMSRPTRFDDTYTLHSFLEDSSRYTIITHLQKIHRY